MGVGTRIFLVDDHDTVRRLPLTRFERLRREDPEDSLPEFAGKRVRFALAVLELAGRRPVEVIRIEYCLLSFDSKGYLDRSEREKQKKLGASMVAPYGEQTTGGSVIDAKHQFAKKKFADRYIWTPTPEIEAAIFDAIFGKRPA
jgi:hypothetical protein